MTGAADLFLEDGDPDLWKPLAAIWTNVVTEKMYITGGCGALYDGAAPDGAKDQEAYYPGASGLRARFPITETSRRITRLAPTSETRCGTGECF